MIEITIGLLGLLIAWFTYQKTFLDKPKEEIEHFVLQYKATQSTSVKVRNQLIALVDSQNIGDSEIFSGVTFNTYIRLMKETYDKNLSDELLGNMLKMNPSKAILKSITDSLEKQLAELIQLETMIFVRLNP
jgi:Cdc6-like AAA superfamily ATPase